MAYCCHDPDVVRLDHSPCGIGLFVQSQDTEKMLAGSVDGCYPLALFAGVPEVHRSGSTGMAALGLSVWLVRLVAAVGQDPLMTSMVWADYLVSQMQYLQQSTGCFTRGSR